MTLPGAIDGDGPAPNDSLGTFTTLSGSSSPSTPVTSTFTLTVENIATFDTITFTGTMTGSISGTSSSASIHVQHTALADP